MLSLTVVLADGRVIRTGGRARKTSAGYDLTHLFTGSEGTLGFITEITLRLHGLPEATSAAVCRFPDEDAAVRTVIETIQSGVQVARMELLDALQMRAINAYSRMDYPEAPHLFLEFHGSGAGVREQAELVQALAADNGGGDFTWATYEEERSRLWQARHDAYPAAIQLRPGCRPFTTDVCVPISRLAECIRATREDLKSLPMPTTILGHVGDGNFHVLILCDPDSAEELAMAKQVNEAIVLRALEMEGTCTGEHGIGQGKIDYLYREHGAGVDVMRTIKEALDPLGLMNPGKVLPPRP
ncbi:MAG: FAD-linked oxidase C-terminal domain-containing protein [Arhodomonas sp.]|nr:FAD-linked oxidase C-terminal domain-containing protein [Arhodomonas sp.]